MWAKANLCCKRTEDLPALHSIQKLLQSSINIIAFLLFTIEDIVSWVVFTYQSIQIPKANKPTTSPWFLHQLLVMNFYPDLQGYFWMLALCISLMVEKPK